MPDQAPATAAAPRLLTPAAIGTLTLPNRVIMGSMHLGVEASTDAARVLSAFYAARARGGAALIVTGGVAVNQVGAGGRDYGVIGTPATEVALRAAAAAVHDAGGRIALQLFHAGRYASQAAFGLRPVAPSAVYSAFARCEPVALSDAAVRATIDDFARGAAVARALGFDAVEVMGSEGYLVNQFLSPLTNQRHDAWGGDAWRRGAFGEAVTRAIRAAVGPGFPLVFRMSGADLVAGSTTSAETLAFARRLAAAGVDALNVGVGWHEARVPTVQTLVPAGVWGRHAAAVKAAVPELPVIGGNRVNRIADADRLLAETGVDFVSLARPFLADPEIVAKSLPTARGARRAVNICIACDQACIDRSLVGERVSCLVNPTAGREYEVPAVPAVASDGVGGRFAVIGGGPAGLEAARELAAFGHHVELFEAADELGGQFRLARLVPGKADYGATITYFEHELRRLGVTVKLGHRVASTPEALAALAGYDGVVVATGVTPRQPALPGVASARVLAYPAAFEAASHDIGPRGIGQRVAIIGGGGIAVDLSHLLTASPTEHPREAFLREHGLLDAAGALADTPSMPAPGAAEATGASAARHQVTVLLRGATVGAHLGRSTRWALIAALRRRGVAFLPRVTYRAIVPEGVLIGDEQGERRLIEADTIVVAAGQEPDAALAGALRAAGVHCEVVGGAADARGLDAVRAFAQGQAAARRLVGRLDARAVTVPAEPASLDA